MQGFHYKPATAGAPAAVSHRVTGLLAVFVDKNFKNVTLIIFTAYLFLSLNKLIKYFLHLPRQFVYIKAYTSIEYDCKL